MVMVLIIIIVTGVLTVPQALCKILYMLNPINCSGNLVKVRCSSLQIRKQAQRG